MIKKIEGMPDNVIGLEATGKVSAEDYESTVIPSVEAATQGDTKTRMLLVFGEAYEGYEAEAALDDAKMGLHHWADFERIAFVSDHGAQRTAVKSLGFLMPGKVNVFQLADLEEAKAWVAE